MHGVTDSLGQMGAFATLLLQHGPGPRDPLDELWDPDFILLIVFLGVLVAVVVWLGVRIFPKVRRNERLEAPRDAAEEILERLVARRDAEAAYTDAVARGEFSNTWVDAILDEAGLRANG